MYYVVPARLGQRVQLTFVNDGDVDVAVEFEGLEGPLMLNSRGDLSMTAGKAPTSLQAGRERTMPSRRPGVPSSLAKMADIPDPIDGALEGGRTVYLHC